MSIKTLSAVISNICLSGWLGETLEIIWHAGEPLVLPIEYYRAAVDLICQLIPASTRVTHCFQSNGILINDDWCTFFNEINAKIGISIDGPKYLNDANRLTRSGESTFAQSLAGIECLKKNSIDFHVITVLTRDALALAQELHDFYELNGINNVCFNVEEIEGNNSDSSLNKTPAYLVEEFYRQFWNIFATKKTLNYVREFNDMLCSIVAPAGYEVENVLTTPFSMLNVDWRGNYTTFSPELLGMKSDIYSDFIIGNLLEQSLSDGLRGENFEKLSNDILSGVDMCKTTCEYYPICGGGSPVNKICENGTFISTETLYCRLRIKALAPVALEIIENSAAEMNEKGSNASPSKIDACNIN